MDEQRDPPGDAFDVWYLRRETGDIDKRGVRNRQAAIPLTDPQI